jgi:hypothetical protein
MKEITSVEFSELQNRIRYVLKKLDAESFEFDTPIIIHRSFILRTTKTPDLIQFYDGGDNKRFKILGGNYGLEIHTSSNTAMGPQSSFIVLSFYELIRQNAHKECIPISQLYYLKIEGGALWRSIKINPPENGISFYSPNEVQTLLKTMTQFVEAVCMFMED